MIPWRYLIERYEQWWNGSLVEGPLLKVFVLSPVPSERIKDEFPYSQMWYEDIQVEAVQYGMSPAPAYLGIREDPETLAGYWLDFPKRIELFESVISQVRFLGDAFPHFFPDLGSSVVASFLGWEPHFGQRSMLNEAGPGIPLEEIEDYVLYNPDSIWWFRCKEFLQIALSRFHGRVLVGFPNLGGALDILACLRGSQHLLMDLIIAPSSVQRLEEKIVHVWNQYLLELSQLFTESGQEMTTSWIGVLGLGRTFPIQSDLSSMISPAMFEEFVVPSLCAMSQLLDHCIYHWDSPGQIRHLDHLLRIERIQAIQWSPGFGNPPCDDEIWLPYYRRITDSGKGLLLTHVKPARVHALASALPKERLAMNVICNSVEEAQDLLSSSAFRWE